jgi:adenine-specific DNA-methyltransferase
VSYVTEESSEINLDLLLALLNSKILDWYFRLGSTNSKVNEYQFNALPVPAIIERGPDVEWKPSLAKSRWGELAEHLGSAVSQPCVMPRVVAEALAEMSRKIQEVEARRILKNRSERSRLAPESQPIQDAIDAVLFRCYGLTADEGRYITRRLREML